MFDETTATIEELYAEADRLESLVEERLAQAQESRKRDADTEYKAELDNRIRLAMTNLAACMKEQGLAFEAPSMYDTRKHLNAFNILDVSKSDPARSGARIQIRTMYNGFNWD